MVMKLYVLPDGPPSLAVRQVLAHLEIPYEKIDLDFQAGDHLTEKYALLNPQKEIPVLDDEGFILGESVAIMQYICDNYRPGTSLYPQDPKIRAIVNHRLCFTAAYFFGRVVSYSIVPFIIPGHERTPEGLKRLHAALEVLETYLTRTATTYAAADHLTIADFPLINSIMTLETVDFDFSKYQKVTAWYEGFKKNYPELWKISEDGMKFTQAFIANSRKSS